MFTVYTKPGCPHCTSAKQALSFKNLPYEEKVHITIFDLEDFIKLGFRSFPQIFEDGVHIGGNDELQLYLLEKY